MSKEPYIGNPISKWVEHNFAIAFNPFFGSKNLAIGVGFRSVL